MDACLRSRPPVLLGSMPQPGLIKCAAGDAFPLAQHPLTIGETGELSRAIDQIAIDEQRTSLPLPAQMKLEMGRCRTPTYGLSTSKTAMSARLPGSIEPISPSRPSALAALMVAISIVASAGMRVGSRWRTCCINVQLFICSTMSTL